MRNEPHHRVSLLFQLIKACIPLFLYLLLIGTRGTGDGFLGLVVDLKDQGLLLLLFNCFSLK